MPLFDGYKTSTGPDEMFHNSNIHHAYQTVSEYLRDVSPDG